MLYFFHIIVGDSLGDIHVRRQLSACDIYIFESLMCATVLIQIGLTIGQIRAVR